jgi:hypothetical protein
MKIKTPMDQIEEYQKDLKKEERYFQNHGSDQVCFAPEDIKKLMETGYLPKELGEAFFKRTKEDLAKQKEWKKFAENNPHLTLEEKMKQFFGKRTLSIDDTVKSYEDILSGSRLLKFLFENRELLQPGALDDLPRGFFKSLKANEFGIARLVADPINKIPELLKGDSLPELISDNVYLITWGCSNSIGDKLHLEHRFRADSKEEASKRVSEFIQRITGRQKKVFEACWAMANKKLQRTFTCELTELMEVAYPGRKTRSYFSTKEKINFYQDLLDLSVTNFKVFKEKQMKPKRKKEQIESFILPFVTIHKITEKISDKESDRYPNQISLSVLHNPFYENEKLYSVGAAIKYATLDLEVDDMQLAEWIQIRKNQLMNECYLKLDRAFLIRLAKLEGTNQKNPTMANKRLLTKLSKLKEKGIILSCPKQIKEIINIKVR